MPTTGFTEIYYPCFYNLKKITTPALTTVKVQLLEYEKCQQPLSMAAISILTFTINSSCLCVSENSIQDLSVYLMYNQLNRIIADT